MDSPLRTRVHTSTQRRTIHLPLEKIEKCSNKECSKSSGAAKLRACSACGEALYCSSECQKSDWAAHKPICGQTDRIDLQPFYPFLALVKSRFYINDDLARHPALIHQIVNNPLSEDFLIPLPTGGGARLVILGEPLGSETNLETWWPFAPSDEARYRLFMRIAHEGTLLPSLLALSLALVSEMYTTTAIPRDQDPESQLSGRRRVRLSYNNSPIADFGIAHGSIDVKDSNRLAYYQSEDDDLFVEQDPDDHYWLYFKTLAGNEYVLDCGLLSFNYHSMPHVSKLCEIMDFRQIEYAPAFFYGRHLEKSFPVFEEALYTTKKKVSILRDERLQDLSFVNSFESEPDLSKDIAVILSLVEEISGGDSTDMRTVIDVQSTIEFIPEAISSMRKAVRGRLYQRFPDKLEYAAELYPDVDEELEARADRLSKHMKKCSKKLKRGEITPEQWVKEFKKHTD